MVCCFKLVANVVRDGVWQFVYDTNRSAFLERDLVRLDVNGNWQVWVRYSGGEAVSIYTVRKGTAGFSNVKGITFSTLKLVDWVHGFAVSMGSNGVSEVGAGTGERVGGMMNGASLASGSIAGLGACGGRDLCPQ